MIRLELRLSDAGYPLLQSIFITTFDGIISVLHADVEVGANVTHRLSRSFIHQNSVLVGKVPKGATYGRCFLWLASRRQEQLLSSAPPSTASHGGDLRAISC